MLTVWKFPLQITQKPQSLEVAQGSFICLVAMQEEKLCLWFAIDTTLATEKRKFAVYGTGYSIPPDRTHVGSVIDGSFVWHVYELEKPHV